MEKKGWFKKLIHNSIVNLIFAVIFTYLSLREFETNLLTNLLEELKELKHHHWAALFGFWHVLKAGTDLYEWVKRFLETFRQPPRQAEGKEEK